MKCLVYKNNLVGVVCVPERAHNREIQLRIGEALLMQATGLQENN
jgi:hypothetical protein